VEKGTLAVAKIRIGSPDYLSVQPLIYGLTKEPPSNVELVDAEPGALAEALDRNLLDAALIPSIEFLRGVGKYFLDDPALVVRGRTGGLLLATDRPIFEIKRVAVAENSRTPVAVLRILLHKGHQVMPDFCVYKGNPDDWREQYDAILLTGDQGLKYCMTKLRPAETCHDLGEMWCSLYPSPLVLAIWAYNDERFGDRLRPVLVESRDLGVKELSRLADGVSLTTEYDSQFVYDYLSRGWSYHIGRSEEGGLKILEDFALEYQLIQQRRLGKVLMGQG
jgi:chorismate dehydratase